MDHCCESKSNAVEELRHTQRRTLQLVLALNGTMFIVELVAGWLGRSTSILGDALDMFGDAAVYGVSLYVLDRGPLWQARAALLKGLAMAVLGLSVLGQALLQAYEAAVPYAPAMGVIGSLALVANVTCLLILLRHRSDDLNMSSAWTCSRNDIIANVAVLLAAGLVSVTQAGWPDILVGVSLSALFLASAAHVLRNARAALRLQAG